MKENVNIKKVLVLVLVVSFYVPSFIVLNADFQDLNNNEDGLLVKSREVLIQSEDSILHMKAAPSDVFVIINPYNIRWHCNYCGANGLYYVRLYENYANAFPPCPYIDYPTGECNLYHYKVSRVIRCSYCGFQSSKEFLYDRVEAECSSMAFNLWVKPGVTHNQGYDRHQCPASCCQDVYKRFQIKNLK